MKKLLRNSLIVFILLFFVLNFSSDAQIFRDTRLTRPATDGLFTISQGWVAFLNYQNSGESNWLMAEMTVKLKDNNYYRLEMVKLNGKKLTFHNAFGGRWQLNLQNFNCQAGQTFNLTAVLLRKEASRITKSVPIIVKLASYRVNNLIKEISFPAPGQLISLIPRPNPRLTFKWKFTGSSQKTTLRVRKVLGNEVSRTEQTVSYCNILKSKFETDKEYKIRLGRYSFGDPKNSFTFTRAVVRGSKLTFGDEFYSKFKTKKRTLRSLLYKK